MLAEKGAPPRAQRSAVRALPAALLRRPALRRPRHDRHRGDAERRHRRGAEGLLPALVPARPGHHRDGRRRRSGDDGGADPRPASAAGGRKDRRRPSPITAASPSRPAGRQPRLSGRPDHGQRRCGCAPTRRGRTRSRASGTISRRCSPRRSSTAGWRRMRAANPPSSTPASASPGCAAPRARPSSRSRPRHASGARR